MAKEEEQQQLEEEDHDDFSFPTTTDPPTRFIESPPLWGAPSKFPAERNHQLGESRKVTNYYYNNNSMQPQRKSFSYIEGRRTRRRSSVGNNDNYDYDYDDDDVKEQEEEEEKMDMLWEDFNEEFSAAKKMADSSDRRHLIMSPGAGRMLNLGCVQLQQALKLSKTNYSKKPSIVEFVKVLKKMFLNQNSHRPVNKNHQW